MPGDPKRVSASFLDVHRKLDRSHDPIIFVLGVKDRRLERSLNVLALGTELPEIEKHLSTGQSTPQRFHTRPDIADEPSSEPQAS
jgi:hypothetical protein